VTAPFYLIMTDYEKKYTINQPCLIFSTSGRNQSNLQRSISQTHLNRNSM